MTSVAVYSARRYQFLWHGVLSSAGATYAVTTTMASATPALVGAPNYNLEDISASIGATLLRVQSILDRELQYVIPHIRFKPVDAELKSLRSNHSLLARAVSFFVSNEKVVSFGCVSLAHWICDEEKPFNNNRL